MVKARFQIILECIWDHAEMQVRDNNSSVCLPFVSWRPSNISQGKPVKAHIHTRAHTHRQAGNELSGFIPILHFAVLLMFAVSAAIFLHFSEGRLCVWGHYNM